MLTHPKQLQNLLKRSEASSRFTRFLWIPISRPWFTVIILTRSLLTNQAPGDCYITSIMIDLLYFENFAKQTKNATCKQTSLNIPLINIIIIIIIMSFLYFYIFYYWFRIINHAVNFTTISYNSTICISDIVCPSRVPELLLGSLIFSVAVCWSCCPFSFSHCVLSVLRFADINNFVGFFKLFLTDGH